MTEFTKDPEKLRHDWTKLYLNIAILKSRNPVTKMILEEFKPKMYRFNEDMSRFLDELGGPVEEAV